MANILLTKNEKKIMDLLWETGRPLTGSEIAAMAKDAAWQQSFVLRCLNSMEEKSVIKNVGTVRNSRRYSRLFAPAVTREEYAAKLALSCGIGRDSVLGVSMALAKETHDEKLYEKLEDIVRQLGEES